MDERCRAPVLTETHQGDVQLHPRQPIVKILSCFGGKGRGGRTPILCSVLIMSCASYPSETKAKPADPQLQIREKGKPRNMSLDWRENFLMKAIHLPMRCLSLLFRPMQQWSQESCSLLATVTYAVAVVAAVDVLILMLIQINRPLPVAEICRDEKL